MKNKELSWFIFLMVAIIVVPLGFLITIKTGVLLLILFTVSGLGSYAMNKLAEKARREQNNP